MFQKSAIVLFFGWLVLDTLAKLAGMPIQGIYWIYSRRYAMSTYVVNEWEPGSPGTSLIFLIAFSVIRLVNLHLKNNTVKARQFTSFALVTCVVVPLAVSDTQGIKVNQWWSWSMLYCAVVFFLTLWQEKEWLDLMRRRTGNRRRW